MPIIPSTFDLAIIMFYIFLYYHNALKSLGHASIKTTEKYLGVEQNLHDAPCDRLGLNLAIPSSK